MDLEALERVLSAWPSSLGTGQLIQSRVLVLEQFQTIIGKVIDDETNQRFYRGGHQSEHRRKIDTTFCVGGDELIQALGLVEEEEDEGLDVPDYVEQEVVEQMFAFMRKRKIPEEVTLDELRRAQTLLRAAIRAQWDPPAHEGTVRLEARVAELPHQKCAQLLTAAATRDAVTRASVEEALRRSVPSTAPWTTLPDLIIHRIAMMLQGRNALLWCAACRAFRAAQPAVRTLNIGNVFGFGPGAAEAEAAATAAAEDGLVIGFPNHDDAAHRIIDSMSARHGAELRCLRYDAVHASHHDPHTNALAPKPLRGPGWENRVHGAQLTGLQKLHITHRAAGHSFGNHQLQDLPNQETLPVCTKALLRSVAGTLRELDVHCVIRLSFRDLLEVMPVVGPGLHHLKIKVVPYNPFHQQASGRLEHTQELLAAVTQHCTALRSPAEVVAHRDARR